MADGVFPALYTAEQVRLLDRAAIESGIDGFDLMRRAGRAAFRRLRRNWPAANHLVILCGGGNNGGDGYVIAGLGLQQGLQVSCIAVSDPKKLSGEARQAERWAREQGVTPDLLSDIAGGDISELLASADVVVDSLLGTGLSGDVRDPYRAVITQLNASGRPVFAVDCPSGLCSDTGRVLGIAVVANLTATFIGRKAGLYTGRARHYTGAVHFDDLGVPEDIYQVLDGPRGHLVTWDQARKALPPVSPCAHKGHMGRVLVVGGDTGMGGAGILAAEAALRCGSGLVYLATRAEHVPPALARRPEIQVRAVASGHDLAPLLSSVDVVIIGPGLGQGPWGQQMLQLVLGWDGPVVVDADALNLLASADYGVAHRALPGNWIATPHPGEAARLLGVDATEIERDRYAAMTKLQGHASCTWVLKGAGTLVAEAGKEPAVIAGGNAGMASGGMGDVLSGVIGSLLGQGMTPLGAAVVGASLHGAAADTAVITRGLRGLLAADVCEALPAALAGLPADTAVGGQVDE